MISLLMFGLGLFLLWEVSQEGQEGAEGRGDKVPGHLQEAPALAPPYLQSSRSCQRKEIPSQEESNDLSGNIREKDRLSLMIPSNSAAPLQTLRVPRNSYTHICQHALSFLPEYKQLSTTKMPS